MGKDSKESFKKAVDKLWPATKKELEKAINSTKEMLNKGESYIKVMSEKSVDKTRKLSLVVKREKLYYTLGKSTAQIPKSKWPTDKKISKLIKDVKALDKEIKKIG